MQLKNRAIDSTGPWADSRAQTTLRTLMPFLLLLSLAAYTVDAAPIRTQEVSVDDPRPLSAALTVLQDLHGVAITYEDPVFSHPGDLVPRSELGSEDGLMIPRGGHLSVKYLVDTRTGAMVDPLGTIEHVIEKHAAKGYPGRFQVVEIDDVFHVTPVATRTASGAWQAQTSALARPISLVTGATGLETITAIADGLGSVLGREVWSGMAPYRALLRLDPPASFSNEPARDALMRLLRDLDGVASWHLYHDPTLDVFALNIHRSLPTVAPIEVLEEPPAAFEGSKRVPGAP